ncbi:MAG: hypothetical protein LBH80_08270 [Prevotellaceae bacterium]|jgi:hypothetical protein|nr:hypothetical protein [Prevotellaceae bacterium]
MKRSSYIVLFLFGAFVQIGAQGYYIRKSNHLKGDFPIHSVLLVTDSIEDRRINRFSDSFADNLKSELKKHNIDCYVAKRNTPTVVADVINIIEAHNPSATITLSPNRPVYIQFKMLRPPKASVMFDFVLSYRNADKSSDELYNTGIGVSIEELPNVGKEVCREIVEKMIKARYIK